MTNTDTHTHNENKNTALLRVMEIKQDNRAHQLLALFVPALVKQPGLLFLSFGSHLLSLSW